MKRNISFIGLVFLAILIPFTALASPVGKFTNVEGRVDITRSDQAAVQVSIGDEVFEKDIIRAKSKSRAEILFVDGNVMRIAQSTRVEISEFISNDEQKSTVIKLFRGKVQNKVKKFIGSLFGRSRERFEVHTPTSVCGVRGTNFFTFYQNGLSGAVFKDSFIAVATCSVSACWRVIPSRLCVVIAASSSAAWALSTMIGGWA